MRYTPPVLLYILCHITLLLSLANCRKPLQAVTHTPDSAKSEEYGSTTTTTNIPPATTTTQHPPVGLPVSATTLPPINIPSGSNTISGIVYVRVPRTTGQHIVTLRDGSNYTLESPDMWDRLPDARHKFRGFNAPGELIYRAPDGTEKILFSCMDPNSPPCVPLDPSVSFDGSQVIFSVYRGTKLVNAWWDGTDLPNKQLGGSIEAQLHVVQISTGTVTALQHTPGDIDVSPIWLPGNKIMFASTRAKTRQPWIYQMSPTNASQPQLYLADVDGSNAQNISPHELSTAMHPYLLGNGRVAYSSQWLSHNLPFVSGNGGINFFTTTGNMWMISDIDIGGRGTSALLGAHRAHSFRDSVRSYTRNFKALHFLGQRENNDICAANYYRGNNLGLGEVFCWPQEPPGIEGRPGNFLPRNIYNVAAWSTSNDQRSWHKNGVYLGKISYPEGIANNQLMLTVGRGYCAVVSGTVKSFQNDVVNQPGKMACDTGIYQTSVIPSVDMTDLIKIVDRPQWHEFSARTLKSKAIHVPPVVETQGRCILASSDTGTGETQPHRPYKFNTNYETAAHNGSQIHGVNLAELAGMRFWEVLPNKGSRPAGLRSVIGNKLRLLGDTPLLSDKSFVAELPCDTPYIMAGIDATGHVIMRDQVPQSLRPKERRVCTGCHLHSRPGRPYDQSIAYSSFPVILTTPKPVPTFVTDIKPMLQKNCASCHVNTGNVLVELPLLDYNNLVWDFFQKALPTSKRIQVTTSTDINRKYGLHRPYVSKFVNSMYARESLLYWKAANKRMDGRTDSTYPNDIDFGANHPTSMTPQELKTLALWLDSGSPLD